jgi:uncharacterized protein (TIGR00255 family)
MVKSMTGAAALTADIPLPGPGAALLQAQWELRAVNGRGLDLRLRLPEGIEGLEAALRARLSQRLKRGAVNLSLRLARNEGAAALRPDPVALAAALRAVAQVQAAAEEAGVALRPPTAAEVLGLRGVLVAATDAGQPEPLLATLTAQADGLIDRFDASRAAEGAALAAVLAGQLDRIAALLAEGRALLPARRAEQAAALAAAITRLVPLSAADPGRLEQELALLAVRADITEELDRLDAHIAAARSLLAADGPLGRQLEFLIQEFNREANTLCSKAQHAGLTRIGLDLKTVIDQMREQALNLE